MSRPRNLAQGPIALRVLRQVRGIKQGSPNQTNALPWVASVGQSRALSQSRDAPVLLTVSRLPPRFAWLSPQGVGRQLTEALLVAARELTEVPKAPVERLG
jgi:hypothetical protein